MKTGFWNKCLTQHLRLSLLFISALSILNFSNIVDSSSEDKTLIVIVKNVKSESGYIHVALYNNKENFLKKYWRGETVNASKGEVVVRFTDIPEGEYAIGIIHDENKNEKLDTNFIGMPNEGYGFSNDATGLLGPPKFDNAKFQFALRKEVLISMKYL